MAARAHGRRWRCSSRLSALAATARRRTWRRGGLGEALVVHGDFARAETIFSRLIAGYPDDLQLLELRAATLEKWSSRADESVAGRAVADFEALADAFAQATNGQRAVRYYERASALGGGSFGRMSKLARVLLRGGEKAKARENEVRAIEFLLASGREGDARDEAEQFAVLVPGDAMFAEYLTGLRSQSGTARGRTAGPAG